MTGWLRGRYGEVEARGESGGHWRWRVLRPEPGAFDVEVSADALDEDRVRLREWLEAVAEDVSAAALDPPGRYLVSGRGGVTKSVPGSPPQRVRAGG